MKSSLALQVDKNLQLEINFARGKVREVGSLLKEFRLVCAYYTEMQICVLPSTFHRRINHLRDPCSCKLVKSTAQGEKLFISKALAKLFQGHEYLAYVMLSMSNLSKYPQSNEDTPLSSPTLIKSFHQSNQSVNVCGFIVVDSLGIRNPIVACSIKISEIRVIFSNSIRKP